MTARGLRLGLALSALLLISACATRPPVPAADARAVDRETRLNRWAEHRQALDAWAQFQLEGRVAASGQALSAQLRWVQREDRQFDLWLSGPIGIGAVRLSGTPERVEIRARRETWTSTEPEADLTALLGWSPPLTALPYWARGLPEPGVAVRFHLDAAGRITQLEQAGWTMTVVGYGDTTPALPTRIEWQRDAQTVTLISDRWQRTP